MRGHAETLKTLQSHGHTFPPHVQLEVMYIHCPVLQRRMVPTTGIFFTPLRLVDAFLEYDEFFALSRRKYVPPNFAEIRHILNIAQVHLCTYLSSCRHGGSWHAALLWQAQCRFVISSQEAACEKQAIDICRAETSLFFIGHPQRRERVL